LVIWASAGDPGDIDTLAGGVPGRAGVFVLSCVHPDEQGGGAARAAPWVLGACVVVVLAPAVVVGVVAARVLRRRALRWTWALGAAVPGALVLVVAGPGAAGRLAGALGEGRPAGAVWSAVVVWVGVAPLVAVGWGLVGARRDRLHGGAAERAAGLARGPLEWFCDRRELVAERGAGRRSAQGVLVGCDEVGRAVRLPMPAAHVTIVGGSDSGKTNTAAVLLEAQVAGGGGFVVLDGKGGRDLPHLAVALGARYRRPVALWSIGAYGDPTLDAHRLAWNAAGDGTPTQVKDRIASAEEQSEPYYAAIAQRGLLAAGQALESAGEDVDLGALARLLDQPKALQAALRVDPDRFSQELGWLADLNDGERSALRGMGVRLRTMVASDGGPALLPGPGGRELALYEALRGGWLVVFTLPQGLYPALIPQVTRYALQALTAVCARVEASGAPVDAMVFVDELSAFRGDDLAGGLERGRSAGVRYMVATQSVSNFAAAGGDKLLHAALDNAEVVVIHRQAVPDAAELLASIGGTEEAWEHTHQVSDAHGPFGRDESGQRARRLTDRFRAHPNVIKQLGQGEAVVVSQRPCFAVRRVRIDRAML